MQQWTPRPPTPAEPTDEGDKVIDSTTPRLIVVVGGQFGSESKGRVTAALVRRLIQNRIPVWNIRVAGPNAGHVVYSDSGVRLALRQVPAGAVDPEARLYIAPGSEIDPQVLFDEIGDLATAGCPVRDRLVVHPYATVIDSVHKEDEANANLTARVGSTGKGIGAARAARLMRTARRVCDDPELMDQLEICGVVVDDPTRHLNHGMTYGQHTVVIEGTQGYGLGQHTEFYPQCTSSDCRAVDFVAMAGLDPWAVTPDRVEVHVVARAHPIRVAGNSGPLKGETSWDDLGLPVELTTVTQKVRRVGEWDSDLVHAALLANGAEGFAGTYLSMAMMDHLIPELAGATSFHDLEPETARKLAAELARVVKPYGLHGNDLSLIGTGPTTSIFPCQALSELIDLEGDLNLEGATYLGSIQGPLPGPADLIEAIETLQALHNDRN